MRNDTTRHVLLVTLVIVVNFTCSSLNARETQLYIPVSGSAWHLAVGDADSDGRNELFYATYQGQVGCVDPQGGRHLWQASLGGFPFDLEAADLDADGTPEVLVACSDGAVNAFSANGKSLWTFRPNSAAMNQVVICRAERKAQIVCGGFGRVIHLLTPSGKEVAQHDFGRAIHQLAAVDTDGDERDEVLAIAYKRKKAEALAVDDHSIRNLGQPSLPDISSPRSRMPYLVPYSTAVGDLDGDGRPEVVCGTNYGGGSRVAVVDNSVRLKWVSPPWRGLRTAGFERQDYFSMTLVATGEISADSPGREVVAVTQGSVGVYSATGELLGAAHAPIGFASVAIDGPIVYLGSSPNGDDTIYRIDMTGDWKQAVSELTRHGLARRIGQNLAEMQKQVDDYSGRPPTSSQYLVRLNMFWHNREPQAPGSLAWFRGRFPYANIEPIAQCGGLSSSLNDRYVLDAAGEPVQPLREAREGRSVEELVAWARTIEEKQIPTHLHFDHGCQPRLRHDTLRQMINASPNSLRGFMSHEDERFERLPDYCGRYLAGVAELCEAAGKELLMQEKNVWWFAMPSHPTVFDGLFAGGRGNAIAAGCDNANSRTPELNLLGRFGLRQAGLIGHIQSSTISDLFCWSRMREWEYPKHGHPYFRLLVAECVLGADRFYVRMDNYHGDRFTAMAEEGVGLFLDMLGKGIVFAPRPEQMVGTSRIGFAVHFPAEKWFDGNWSGHAVDSWTEDAELENAVIPHGSVVWGNTPTPPHALQAVVLNKKRQFGAHVPATPYGPCVFVPAQADLSKVPFVADWWHTDGIHIWREGGPKLTGMDAATALRESIEQAARKLPFRAVGDDVFFHVVQVEPYRYRIFAIDPGWLDPAQRQINVHIQVPGTFTVRDLLGGEQFSVKERHFQLTVPAGSARFIEAVKRGATPIR